MVRSERTFRHQEHTSEDPALLRKPIRALYTQQKRRWMSHRHHYSEKKGGSKMSTGLIIADDEYFIRQSIKKIIPWKNLDIEFAGEAENGKQVVELLGKVRADILLLDIKMPQMDGIETARYIKERFPHVHIIILSGYND